MLVANNHNSSYAESYETDNERSNSKTTIDFITQPFCRIDDEMKGIPKHPIALLFFSEIVNLGFMFALKGGGSRAFYRWLEEDYLPLYIYLPEHTRKFRLFAAYIVLVAECYWISGYYSPSSIIPPGSRCITTHCFYRSYTHLYYWILRII